MGTIYKNGVAYGGAPTLAAASGSHINETGTPTVTATTADGVTTFTFDYLKGQAGSSSASGVSYDNTTSGMSATTTQGAVDELSAEKANGEGLTFSINNGLLRVSYDDGQ